MPEYPILQQNKPIGTLRVTREGLHTVFSARAKTDAPRLRLAVCGARSRAYLGLMLPDGSGALMPINSEDQRQTGYQVAVMNRQKDEALTMNSMNLRDIPYYENTIMPVFGQKQDDNAYFCIIEEGYEFANIVAYVADNFTKFNTAFTSFFPIVTDEIYYASGTASGITMFPKVKVEEEKTVIERKRDKETNELISKEVIEKVVSNYCRRPICRFGMRSSPTMRPTIRGWRRITERI